MLSSRIRRPGRDIVVKDMITDAFLQQILLRPAEYDVIATLNLNGDYISDALAAEVGGIGIAPGANLSDYGRAMFEATHGTAPKYAGKDYVNPGLGNPFGEMMLATWAGARRPTRHHVEPREGDRDKVVTYDFARLMAGADPGVLLGLRPGDDRADVGRDMSGPRAMALGESADRAVARTLASVPSGGRPGARARRAVRDSGRAPGCPGSQTRGARHRARRET